MRLGKLSKAQRVESGEIRRWDQWINTHRLRFNSCSHWDISNLQMQCASSLQKINKEKNNVCNIMAIHICATL